MGTCASFHRQCAGSPWKSACGLLERPPQDSEARLLPKLHARAQSSRTLLETCEKGTGKPCAANASSHAVPSAKDIQQFKRYALFLPLFKRLAINKEEVYFFLCFLSCSKMDIVVLMTVSGFSEILSIPH